MLVENMHDCKFIANQAHAMETPTPKKRTLGLTHYFMSVKKQKSEEQLTKQEDSQHHEGLQEVQEVKEEEVKTEKDDKECEKDLDYTTPRIKYTREDFVRCGKKGGRPSQGTKHTPPSLKTLFTKKASTEEFEENAAIRKERYKNARDGAR